ncbi:MAG: translation elongation factor 4, partial [Clostridia bacterium]|nr:translation elongation factor 4 [Clostridia bacterium]
MSPAGDREVNDGKEDSIKHCTRGGSRLTDTRLKRIRNFCIIAHIDHGKSTLADRILETTGVFQKREMVEQILDSMELERERGITIKSKAVRMNYTALDGETYELNLIDTPGHVDFTYEVSRALAACEGALLVVDATQGIEAQTLANCYMALDHNLEIIPVINKIDLPSAEPEKVKAEIEDVIGLDASYAPCISAKTGQNIGDVLEAIVKYVPAPTGDADAPLQALIFDAFYDNYRGAICFVRVKEGTVKPGMRMRLMATGGEFDIVEVGTFSPGYEPCEALMPGDVGYIAASIKDVRDTRVGDTITDAARPAAEALPGYKQVTPMVFCGIYPADGADYPALKDALEKLRMNDASLTFEPETSVALGYGFRCGFLGLLHMDVITQRLEREFDLDLVTTIPGVVYHIHKTDGTELHIDNPTKLPPVTEIASTDEPFVRAEIFTPQAYVGTLMDLCQEKRGIFIDMQYEGSRVKLNYDMPLNEIIFDFFDTIKSRSRGYASFDYELKDYRPSDLVKLDILLNGDLCDAFSQIVHRDRAYPRGRVLCEKLKEVIPRQQFEIPIQAAIGGKIIARETVKAMRKDVLAKCYGGDITRKKKLLEKQKEGKKRMRQFGTVQVPSEA